MTRRVLLWDFDGTLAFREGMWSGTFLEIMGSELPGLVLGPGDVRPLLGTGFPWHTPMVPHPGLCDPEAWWRSLLPMFERTFLTLGADPGRVPAMAGRVWEVYCSPARWHLYDDTLETLQHLSACGWEHVVLSNHVPELAEIVRSVGLGGIVGRVFSSALTGREKPNPEAFRPVLGTLPSGSRAVMIGDSMEADVRGALGAGIPAILVRRPPEPGVPCSPDLSGVVPILSGDESVL
jgi:putative hydrolase of the HAD superfamily